jgi:hypothetical protein
LFSGGTLDKGGATTWKMSKIDQELDAVKQARGRRRPGRGGAGAGQKKFKVPRLPWSTGAHRPNEPLRSTSSVSRPDDGPGSSAQMNISVVVY